MVIGIDVDGVLRDFCGALVDVIKKDYPQYFKKDYNPETEPDVGGDMITDWFLANNFACTKPELQQIYWYDHADKIMGNGNPIYGSIQQMYDLFDWAKENKHSLVCVTSQKEHARYHTLSWLGKYGLNFDTVYFRRGFQKPDVQVDYLVDDSPNNFKYWVNKRGMQEGFILMDRPYNQEVKSNYRIKELKQVKEIIDG